MKLDSHRIIPQKPLQRIQVLKPFLLRQKEALQRRVQEGNFLPNRTPFYKVLAEKSTGAMSNVNTKQEKPPQDMLELIKAKTRPSRQ